MKILFADNTLWGLVNFRGEVIRHFLMQGDDVVLVAPEKEDEQMRTAIPKGVRYVPVSMGRTSMNPVNDLKYFFQMMRVLHREKPDYVFNYTIKPNIYGTLAARLLGVHSTAMMAGLGYIFINDNVLTRMARALYRFGLRFTEHLLVLNRYNAQLVEKNRMCPMHKVILLEGGEGINLSNYEVTDNASAATTFLYIGRILWDKGYEELSQAARIVKQKHPDVRVELLGSMDPNYPKNVPAERVKADESDGILSYIGFTSDMASVYQRKGIVVVLPSYSEGMNRALMEACASGKPIITTDIPGCREAVDEGCNGYLVPPRDAEALAQAMLRFIDLDKQQKAEFSAASRRKAESTFDVEKVIRVYDDIVKEALQNP